MKKIDKKKTGIAIAAVPVIAAGTVAMVSAYKQGMEFTPTDSRRDFQANKVVFENDENALDHQNSGTDEESRLLQQKNSEENQGADLQNQADYLFEDQKIQQETGNETTIGIDEEQNGDEAKKSDGAPTTELQNPQQNQPDETYHVTENPDNADMTIRGNDGTIPAGNHGNPNGNGNTNGTQTPSGNGTQEPLTPSVTPAPSVTPGILPNPTETPEEPIITPTPTETPVQPARPSNTVKDPTTSKGQPSDGLITGTTTKPYQDGVTPFQKPNESADDVGSVLISQQIGRSANTLYCGQSVDQEQIYNVLDTYVIGTDGTRYVWGADDLDKYIRIDALSFDGGETWTSDFPVTIPSGNASIAQMMIRVQYRFSTNDDTWNERKIPYYVAPSRVFILSEAVQEGETVLDTSKILNEDQHPSEDQKMNLFVYQSYLLGSDTQLTSLFPGWAEDGVLVPWFYYADGGRHILEPENMVPLDSRYTVQMKHFWMSEDMEVDDAYTNLAYLQTLTDYQEKEFTSLSAVSGSGWKEKHRCETLTVPKYVQAVSIDPDSGLAVDYLAVPDTVLYIETLDDGLRVDKGYQVDENNPMYASNEEGILTNKAGTELIGIPYDTGKVTAAKEVTKIQISVENQISELHLEADEIEDLPSANYEYLNHCKIIVKDELLEEFLQNYSAALAKGVDNCVVSEEEPDVAYTVKDDMIVSSKGTLRRVLKSDRTSLALSNDIDTIGDFAFANTPNITTLILPQSGDVVSLEADALAKSGIETVRCYTMTQYRVLKEQLRAAGAEKEMAVELVGISKEGYHYASTEQNGVVTGELISAPSDVTAFDGVVTAEDGTEVQITVIGDSAFADCTSLQWVTLPESVKTIGYQAFYNCTSLQGILSRSTDTISIGNQSLDGCTSIRFAAFNAMQCTAAEGYSPQIVDSYGTSYFYVPTNAEGYPDTALSFTEESNVTGYDMAVVGENTRVLYGTNEESGMWLALRSGLTLSETVELPDTTIEIFRRAFAGTFAYSGSYHIDWSASPLLWAIDAGAFQASELGGDLALGENCYIGDYAFAECSKIESVDAPGTSVYVDEGAFQSCSSLRSVSFGNMGTNSTIFAGMFTGCDELSSITFADYTAPQIGIYGNVGYQFNFDWSQEEEAEKLRIVVPEGAEMNYIKAWRYLYCGYYSFGDDSAYQLMWTNIQWDNMSWETWEFPADEEVDRILKETLTEKENCIRRSLGIAAVSEPTGFYPYRVEDGMITIIGAPSSTESLYLDGSDLDLPDGWFPDYIGTGMFRSCANLQSVIVPGSIAGIYSNAFDGAKNNRFLLYFESTDPLQLMGWSKDEPFRFGDDESKIEIMTAFGAEEDYINAWMYPMAGYADLNEMLADIRAELSVDGKEPTDLEVYEETGKRLLAVENRLRAMMNLDPISDASGLAGELPGLLETAKTAEAQKTQEQKAAEAQKAAVTDTEEKKEENGTQDSAVSDSDEPRSDAETPNPSETDGTGEKDPQEETDQKPGADDGTDDGNDAADSDETGNPDNTADSTDDTGEETSESEETAESAAEAESVGTEAETAVQSEAESADEEEVQE